MPTMARPELAGGIAGGPVQFGQGGRFSRADQASIGIAVAMDALAAAPMGTSHGSSNYLFMYSIPNTGNQILQRLQSNRKGWRR